jgi:hypothetical protein
VNDERRSDRPAELYGDSICGVHGPPHWLVAKEPAVCIYVRGHAGPHSWEPEED